jgi:membrane-associated phospholipid phosphatase
VRDRIQRAFLRNLLQRQGTALLGRALPFGVGAVVGGVGNRVMGRAVVASAKEAFGPMPDTIPGELTPSGTSGGSGAPAAIDSAAAAGGAGNPGESPVKGGFIGSER